MERDVHLLWAIHAIPKARVSAKWDGLLSDVILLNLRAEMHTLDQMLDF